MPSSPELRIVLDCALVESSLLRVARSEGGSDEGRRLCLRAYGPHIAA